MPTQFLQKTKPPKNSISNNEIPFKLPIVCRKLVRLVKQMKNDPLIDFDPHLCSKLVNVSNIVNSDVNNIGHVNESAIVQVSQNQTNFSNSLSDINLRQDFDCFNYNKNVSQFNGLKVQAEIHNLQTSRSDLSINNKKVISPTDINNNRLHKRQL